MAVSGRSILGIDIGPSEICVVELRGVWPDFQILRAGKTTTPVKAVEGGRVVDPSAVGDALRSLLDAIGASTREAVLSIAESCVVTRVLDVPVVPANEMRTVIEGELAHYQILGNTAGAFDFMLLTRRDADSVSGPQALVMAAEEQVVKGYRAAAEVAGLQLIAMEPTLLACYRAGFAQIQSHPVAACLAIGLHESEITVTCNGQIRLYRRIDIGRDTMMLERHGSGRESAPSTGGRVPFGEVADDPQDDFASPDDQARVINPSTASSLTVELQRSLDYFASQSPEESTIDRLVLTVPVPELAPLETWFTQAIAIETVMAKLPPAQYGGTKTDETESLRYLCAAGLAMRELAGLPASMPRFDLSSQQRTDAVVRTARRTFNLSLYASIGTFALGTLLALQIGFRANRVEQDLVRLKQDLAAQQLVREQYITSVQTRQDLLRSLRTQGFPFPRIMDSIFGAVASKAGLVSVSLDPSGRLTVNGDANNEKEIIKTLESLRRIPYFDSVSMDMFDKQSPTMTSGWLVRFQISCQLTSARSTASAAPVDRRER